VSILPGPLYRAALSALAFLGLVAPAARAQAGFTIEQVTGYPFPTDLTAAATGSRVAWVFTERGVRNIYVAEGPDFRARKVTDYRADDGQELTNLSISSDGRYVVFTRGGDHGSNWPGEGGLQPDPTSSPVQPQVEIYAVPFNGGAPKLVAQGDEPVISPAGDRIAYTSNGQVWVAPVDGSMAGKRMFFAKGQSSSPVWSPTGDRMAFVSNRGDHSFIGIFSSEAEPIKWMAPTTSRDGMPRWSPDGARIAYVRLRGTGGPPQSLLELHPNPWQIWTADTRTGEGVMVWKSPATLVGSVPTSEGGPNLRWMAGRIVFLADLDGWPHLYSVPATGGAESASPLLLTPGKFMVEYVAASPDGKYLVYAANAGPEREDVDRRHVFMVPVDRAAPVQLTPSEGLAWTPVVTGDNSTIAFIAAGSSAPPLPAVTSAACAAQRRDCIKAIGLDRVPADFPSSQLVTPKMVVFRSTDGLEIHGQLFERAGGSAKRPAVVFVHGGPPRQMLLGWHYMYYYSNAYALNQYLASQGYAVLSVNYRLGIGYGHHFHHPEHAGAAGASEYNDVKAAGLYLKTLPEVDSRRIGIWGGSYGGFLTAMALAKNSDIFAAGVDLHGVHDFTADAGRRLGQTEWRYEKGDFEKAATVAWTSSPVAWISSWRSPVLLIQGDDDRNVRFHQTVDLARRLAQQGVKYEELVLPDEIHDFLLYSSWDTADKATAAFLDRTFGVGRVVGR
jgi:dipeptidyl aminopeptidase/acylaminoacyl peptidase